MGKTVIFIVFCVNGHHPHKGFPEVTAVVWVADISTGYTCDGEHAVNLSWTYTMAPDANLSVGNRIHTGVFFFVFFCLTACNEWTFDHLSLLIFKNEEISEI